ncbi:MAG: hypothetical protein HY664_00310 [Chloroflexi bacterium]|nr:hypothetical protein [Chloroflexota bacterium]
MMASRYEREIEELLKRLEESSPKEPSAKAKRDRRQRLARVLSQAWWEASISQLIIGALIFSIIAYVARFVIPSVGRLLVFFVIFLLVWAGSVSWRQFKTSRYWRLLRDVLVERFRNWNHRY